VGVAKADPQLILIIEKDGLGFQFKLTIIAFEALFVFRHIRLVEVVVHHWRNQVE